MKKKIEGVFCSLYEISTIVKTIFHRCIVSFCSHLKEKPNEALLKAAKVGDLRTVRQRYIEIEFSTF